MASKLEYDAQTDKVCLRDGDGIIKYEAGIVANTIVSASGVWKTDDCGALAAHLIAKGDPTRAQFTIAADYKSADVVLTTTSVDAFDNVSRDVLHLRMPCVNADGALVAKLRADVAAQARALSDAQEQLREARLDFALHTIEDFGMSFGIARRRRFSRMLIAAELAGNPIVFPIINFELMTGDTQYSLVPAFARFVICRITDYADDYLKRVSRRERAIISIVDSPRCTMPNDAVGFRQCDASSGIGFVIFGCRPSDIMRNYETYAMFHKFDANDKRDLEAMFNDAREKTKELVDERGLIRAEWLDKLPFFARKKM